MPDTISPPIEPAHSSHHHLLCWKSTFAGVLIALMGYMLLTSFGAGITGLTAQSLTTQSDGLTGVSRLSTGVSVWLVISAAASLFAGSYFSMRISGFVTTKVGAAHAFVVASIFFILLNMTTGMSGFFFGRMTNDPSRIIADAGWSLFFSFLVGLIAAVLGGRVGAHANVTRPFAKNDGIEGRIPTSPRRPTYTEATSVR